jgi:hypothetical protein
MRHPTGRVSVVGVQKDPAELVVPLLTGLLVPDETLRGWCLATEQSTFSGHTTVVGITDRRLLLQAVDRKFRPKDAPLPIRPDELASASADGAGGQWWTATAAIMDFAALSVRLKTTNGEERWLTLMRGTGMFGSLGGGDAQQLGVEALADWLRASG